MTDGPPIQQVADRLIELSDGGYTALIAPTAGGRLASLNWCHGRTARALLVPWDGASFDEHRWPKAGAFPMIPFANRLPRGGIEFGARRARPAVGIDGFPVHGHAHRRPWHVLQANGRGALLAARHDGMSEGWPWRWEATQSFELDASGLRLTLTVINTGSEPMPLSIGWHPYLPLTREAPPDPLTFEATMRHRLDDEGRALAPSFGHERAIGLGDTVVFSSWNGRLRLPQDDGSIEMECEGAAALVVHRPRKARYICAEPVTLLPGGLARPDAAAADGEVQPGQSRRLSVSLGWRGQV